MGIEEIFPGLRNSPYQVTSPFDPVYNCIAWAAGVTDAWWWPVGDPKGVFWPEDVAHEETLKAFRQLFSSVGYAACESEQQEPGFEKIALFADAKGVPQHAARQLSGGRWTSKLGLLEDIEHDLRAIEGPEYGLVVEIMKRPLSSA
jgi:hypothetical protein